jgi:hypothetical protein
MRVAGRLVVCLILDPILHIIAALVGLIALGLVIDG